MNQKEYPNFPNYENFMKATNKSLPFMVFFVNAILAKNMALCKNKEAHFIDSTPVEVCKNNKISKKSSGRHLRTQVTY